MAQRTKQAVHGEMVSSSANELLVSPVRSPAPLGYESAPSRARTYLPVSFPNQFLFILRLVKTQNLNRL